MQILGCICFLYHTEKWTQISQLFYETHTEGIIGDIWDACIVAALRKEGQFLSVPEHTGLIMCCDGVPVSSHQVSVHFLKRRYM